MAYSEAKVIAGGLAHIPVIIGFFGWFKGVNLRRSNVNSSIGVKPKAAPVKEKEVLVPPIQKENISSESKPEEKLLNDETNAPKSIDSSQIDSKPQEKDLNPDASKNEDNSQSKPNT